MKLKKIASLALAGVMAVSMLAGCGDTASSNPDNGKVEVVTTSIVDAVNNGQGADNDVTITFKDDAKLNDALSKAVKAMGEHSTQYELMAQMSRLTGMTPDQWYFDGLLGEKDGINKTLIEQDGDKVTRFVALNTRNIAAAQGAIEKAIAKLLDERVISQLDDTTLNDNTKNGGKYVNFDYEGSVSLVSSTDNDGTVNYYVAVVITRTTNVLTLKGE